MSSSSQAPESWISAFCSLIGHEYFAEVSEDFIEDDFNLTGLQSQVPMYKEALEMILDVEPEDASEEEEEEEDDDDDDDDEMHDGPDGMGRAYRRGQDAAERRHLRMASDLSVIESSAEMLYGLIHQRFITSRQGIQQMAEKYELGHFGQCPRVYCHSAKVLPVGCSDIPGQETVKLFCPSCLDVYSPPNSRFQTVDGAFFGTTFGCLFFMTFPELDVAGQRPPSQLDPSPSTSSPLSSNPNSTQNSSNARGSSWPTQTSFSPIQQQHPGTAHLPPQPESMNGVATKNLAPGLGPGNIYEPRIYGFRVSEVAKTGPRMKWLRSRPADVNELDECRIWAQSRAAEARVAELGDSEMIDDNEELDDGEMEDEDMDADAAPLPSGEQQRHASEQEKHDMASASSQQQQVRESSSPSQRKKQSRRRTHDSLVNGNANGSTGANSVSVGDG